MLEVIKRSDGTFDLFLNGKIERTRISEHWLPSYLCGRFGFCGEEYDGILREVTENGRKNIAWSTPQLKITERAENGIPVAGACSECAGDAQWRMEKLTLENEFKLNEAFGMHVRQMHRGGRKLPR